MAKWWKVGLSANQIARIDQEATERFKSEGPQARARALRKAGELRSRNHLEALHLTRVAAKLAEFEHVTTIK